MKNIKAWAVVWKKSSAATYLSKPDSILPVEPSEQFKIKCRCHRGSWHFGSSMAVFETLKEAKCWAGNNRDWEIVKVTITY